MVYFRLFNSTPRLSALPCFSVFILVSAVGSVSFAYFLIYLLLDQNSVYNALQTVKQLISRPAGIFYVHAVIAALEHLVDTAREKNDAQASRYNSILKQTRPLSSHASFQPVLLKLLRDKEEIAIAKEIEKAFKHSSSVRPLMGNPRMPYSNPRVTITCYACGLRGHIARNCRVRKARNNSN